MSAGARHLYVHLPFCAHRCGYCDFVTAVGRRAAHGPYVDAVLAELELERAALAPALETVFVGGGTPTFTDPAALSRLLGGLPEAAEVTVEANPETVTADLARLLAERGVTRVSLGVQTFQPRLLSVLERAAGPDAVRRAVRSLREAGCRNVSLDLLYGIPGQDGADLSRDLELALALEPEHLSCYELEAKPGTRFAAAWAQELERQAEALEDQLERVVETLTAAGYRWYETASFCRAAGPADPSGDEAGRDLRAQHNLAYWRGRDYLGLGVGAVSTIAGRRWRNRPNVAAYQAALAAGLAPAREVEELDEGLRRRERLMLGLRLDEPLALAGVEGAYDPTGLGRLERLGLLDRAGDAIALTRRGRLLGNAATVELLAEIPANSHVCGGVTAA